jgi:hypothetical protein
MLVRYASAAAMAADDDANFDPYRTLAEHAAHLNGVRRPGWFSKPFYELMSGALVWRDERRRDTPVHVVWALRAVWAYRTSLMLGAPREELAEFWQYGLKHFPQWVGFRPERREPTPELLETYRRGDVSLRKCLRDLEREDADA